MANSKYLSQRQRNQKFDKEAIKQLTTNSGMGKIYGLLSKVTDKPTRYTQGA